MLRIDPRNSARHPVGFLRLQNALRRNAGIDSNRMFTILLLESLPVMERLVLRHRLILNFEGQAENIATDEVVRNSLKQ